MTILNYHEVPLASGILTAETESGTLTSHNTQRFFVVNNVFDGADLNMGASVTLFTPEASKQYYIWCVYFQTFGGFGGNRDISILNNSNIYCSMTPIGVDFYGGTWATTLFPLSTTIPLNTKTSVGQDIIVKYTGGTTDYFFGGELVRISLFLGEV